MTWNRGLKRFIEDDDDRGIRRDLANRIRRVLTALLSVENIEGWKARPASILYASTAEPPDGARAPVTDPRRAKSSMEDQPATYTHHRIFRVRRCKEDRHSRKTRLCRCLASLVGAGSVDQSVIVQDGDPAMRWVVGYRAITGSAASASQMGRFETKWLSRPENLAALADLPRRWIDKVHQRRPPRIVVLDMDSSESPTYGEQEGT
jgi:hypothetical protein